MAIKYKKLQQRVTKLLSDSGMKARISHLEDNSQSSCYLVFGKTAETDDSVDDTTTIVGQTRIAYLSDVQKEVVTGDSVTADGITYLIDQVDLYKPSTINVAFKVLLIL